MKQFETKLDYFSVLGLYFYIKLGFFFGLPVINIPEHFEFYIRRVKSISLETVFAIFIAIILISNMLYTSLFLTM